MRPERPELVCSPACLVEGESSFPMAPGLLAEEASLFRAQAAVVQRVLPQVAQVLQAQPVLAEPVSLWLVLAAAEEEEPLS